METETIISKKVPLMKVMNPIAVLPILKYFLASLQLQGILNIIMATMIRMGNQETKMMTLPRALKKFIES